MKTFTQNKTILLASLVLTLCVSAQASAAVALDRTRVVVNGGDQSETLRITNENKQLPYLAQAWLEDAKGKKISSPMTVLPPVQRVEPGAKSQVKIQVTPAIAGLPQDKETLFYFNLREIPPRSNKPNTLQIALQTRVKLFYRPEAIALDKTQSARGDWVEKVTLKRQGDTYTVDNPTPYFLTLVEAHSSAKGTPVSMKPGMVSPKSTMKLEASAEKLGSHPVLSYINDYGGRTEIQFTCTGSQCSAKLLKDK
ncbi:fimbria/pilus periplasmic chaperone [Enterobacter bugandensis]|nr:fimbria/pilus periplasmic chaperone [Enterobacter bugandensis]QWZ52060.1 fimbria/pilus periplasmic chaperone [Enterobacter bugandensis]UBH42252.1 fimbria/pilus periplasmic chaperone [Enterobacter bugandensis]UBH96168.1 fimbria/pilus periplasmic chaperone [Enterobacter bugandensis]UBI00700.1 fimbria/pilus periplasmic chaperone [Enterobacter bugandensis]